MTDTLVLGIIQTVSIFTTGVLGLYLKNRVKKSDALVVNKIESVHSEVKEVRAEQVKTRNKEVCVLVLDDNPDDLEQIERVIKRTGKKYELYSDEDLYLAKLTDSVDVHIIDHFLQKRSGLEVLKEIKQRNIANYVIAYTGTKDENTIIEYLNAGINKYIDKNNPDHLKQLAKYLNEGIRVSCK